MRSPRLCGNWAIGIERGGAMPGWGWGLVIVAAVVVVAVVMWRALAARRTRSLREGFGPEYDRTTSPVGDKAEASLRRGASGVSTSTFVRFLPSAEALCAAMGCGADAVRGLAAGCDRGRRRSRECGHGRSRYPIHDFERRAGDVSVDHPAVVENYRRAHEISLAVSARRGNDGGPPAGDAELPLALRGTSLRRCSRCTARLGIPRAMPIRNNTAPSATGGLQQLDGRCGNE